MAKAFKVAAWKRGEAACQVCDWKPPVTLGRVRTERLFQMLHAHHVVPVAAGGPDRPANLVLLCPNHHAIAHALGRMTQVGGRKRRVWSGPTTVSALLDEIRWVETDADRWTAHVDGGRDHRESAAQERRSTFAVQRGAVA